MKRIHGYTLIEVMVALLVFAILAVMTASAMYYAFDTRARVAVQADNLNTLQLAMVTISRDVEQIVERPIRGNEMHLFSSFIGQANYIEFTRDGLVNPNGIEQRTSLKRIAYLCRDQSLVRRSWQSLDTPERSQYQDKVLLNNLTHCAFAYLDRNRQVLAEWHENAVQPDQKKESLPTAVRFTLDFYRLGEMSLLFIIPEALFGGFYKCPIATECS